MLSAPSPSSVPHRFFTEIESAAAVCSSSAQLRLLFLPLDVGQFSGALSSDEESDTCDEDQQDKIAEQRALQMRARCAGTADFPSWEQRHRERNPLPEPSRLRNRGALFAVVGALASADEHHAADCSRSDGRLGRHSCDRTSGERTSRSCELRRRRTGQVEDDFLVMRNRRRRVCGRHRR